MLQGASLSIGFLFVLTMICSFFLAKRGIQKNKKLFMVLSLIPLFLFIRYFEEANDTKIEESQIKTITTELVGLYYLDSIVVEPLEKQASVGNQFSVETEVGKYKAYFNPDVMDSFNFEYVDGEDLRGRKNVFDVLQIAGIYTSDSDLVVDYVDDTLYRVEVNEDTLVVRLTDHVVDVIENEDGVSLYVNQDNSTMEKE